MEEGMTTEVIGTGEYIRSVQHLESLPPGSRVAPHRERSRWYERQPDGMFLDYQGYAHTMADFSTDGRFIVLSVPKNPTVVLASLRQWQWRWLDNAWASSEEAGVYANVVEQGMESVSLSWDDFPVGAGMTFRSRQALERVPTESLVYRGDPSVIDAVGTFGMFVKNAHGGMTHVLGRATASTATPLTVESVPDGTVASWATEPGTVEEQDEISEFKARVWRVGWKIKHRQGWCSSYETYMRRVGLDDSVLRQTKYHGIGVGDHVSVADAALLRPNSVLRWQSASHPERWGWVIRDDDANNLARTRYLFGTGARRAYTSTMQVLSLGDDATDLSVPIREEEVRQVPVGSTVQIASEQYTVCGDHRLTYYNEGASVPPRGNWWAQDFGQDITLVRLPS
jgi:hypothetical protein